MPKTRTLLTLVLLPLLVFLVACGGDDDDSDSSSGDQPSASESTDSSSDDSAASDDEDTSTDEADDEGSDDADPSGEEILANCPELLSMFGAFSPAAFANPGADAGEDFEALVAVFQNAADNAPGEIKADMQVMADAFASFYGALDDLGVDFSNPASFASLTAEQQAEFQAAAESLNTAEIEQASDNLDAYFTEHCS